MTSMAHSSTRYTPWTNYLAEKEALFPESKHYTAETAVPSRHEVVMMLQVAQNGTAYASLAMR
jgi:hypothetical protein